jgi:hypothetical protein
MEIDVKGHLHARSDVTLHWLDGKVRQEAVQIPPESEKHTATSFMKLVWRRNSV